MHDIEVSHGNILGRSVGLDLTLDDFQKVSDEVPFLADLKPSGKYVMEDVHKVGFSKNILSCAFNSLLLLKMAEDTSFLVFCEDNFFFNIRFGLISLSMFGLTIVLIDWRNTWSHSLPFGAWIFRWGLSDWYIYLGFCSHENMYFVVVILLLT